MVQRLLKADCPVESDGHGRTLLMQAALHGHTHMVEFLVNNSQAMGVDLEQRDQDERNVLFYWLVFVDNYLVQVSCGILYVLILENKL